MSHVLQELMKILLMNGLFPSDQNPLTIFFLKLMPVQVSGLLLLDNLELVKQPFCR